MNFFFVTKIHIYDILFYILFNVELCIEHYLTDKDSTVTPAFLVLNAVGLKPFLVSLLSYLCVIFIGQAFVME